MMRVFLRWAIPGSTFALVTLTYIWMAREANPVLATSQPVSFYGFLTDALLSGQTHLKVSPHPGLLALDNPYAGSQGIPRLHDASLYHGRYYLYFSAVPVVLLFAPWHLATGTFLADGVGTAFFAVAAFVLTGLSLLRWQRRGWPELHPAAVAVALALLGFGSYGFFMLAEPQVYAVPSLCAYACFAAFVFFLTLALEKRLDKTQIAWWAGATFAYGLAVGCRPNYIFGLPALLVPMAWLASKVCQTGEAGARARRASIVFWGVVPPALVGAALAFYNYIRFGNPLEFGLHYQLAAGDMRQVKLAGWENFIPGLRAYLFTPLDYSSYFPFIAVRDNVFGVLWAAPIVILAPLIVWISFAARAVESAVAVVVRTLAISSALILAGLCLYPFPIERYVIDFLGGLILLISAGFVSVPHLERRRRTIGFLAVGLAMVTIFQGVFLGVQRSPPSPVTDRAASLLNHPSAWLERMTGRLPGPVRLNLILTGAPTGGAEPIISTGNGRDILFIQYKQDGQVQFGFNHRGSGNRLGPVVSLPRGKALTVDVELGSLYPPRQHPAFRGWDTLSIEALRNRVEVRVEGQTVLALQSTFYPGSPGDLLVGRAARENGVCQERFSGSLTLVARPGLPVAGSVAATQLPHPVRLRLRFPPFEARRTEPLLSTGQAGAGDLFYVTYLAPGRALLGHDHWQGGALETEAFDFDPAVEHTIDVAFGKPRADELQATPTETRWQVRFDGRMLISTPRSFHATQPVTTAVGYNGCDSSVAGGVFGGPQLSIEPAPPFAPAHPDAGGYGEIHLVVQLPAAPPGTREPLVASGIAGEGDVVFIIYEDARHVRFGFDHWGVGGATSDPILIDPMVTHRLSIRYGALRPAQAKPGAAGTPDREVQIKVDGRIALAATSTSHPSRPDQIVVGRNSIGASTCGPAFSGRLLLVDREEPFPQRAP